MILIAILALSAQASAPQIADLHWMTGCWSMATPSRTVTEVWLPPAGGTMLGMSRTIANGKTAEYEFIVLRVGPDGLEYVARPSGQSEAVFVAPRVSGSEITFENLKHDFPQRITYRKTEAGLKATISGSVSGKERAIDFNYSPGNCSK